MGRLGRAVYDQSDRLPIVFKQLVDPALIADIQGVMPEIIVLADEALAVPFC